MGSVVYYKSIPHTLSWHQNWINPELKIVPDKYIIFSCLSNDCKNLQFPDVLVNYVGFLKK